MTQRPLAVVLGGTTAHGALIKALKGRGYFTVLVDYLDYPPAKTHADLHVQESTLDPDAVVGVARRLKAKLVLSLAVDQANVVACLVGERLGLPVPYSSRTAWLVTDKGLMKDLMRRRNIPTSPFMVVTKERQAEGHALRWPLVVKPVDATGSKGVRCVNTQVEMESYLTEALALSRAGRAIVEEFVDGTEVQVDYFVQDGHPHRVMTREKMKADLGSGTVLQSIGSMVPAEMSGAAMAILDAAAKEIASGLGLRSTPLFIQAMVLDDKVQVLEFALRIGGGLSFAMIKRFRGFDIMEAAVDACLGNRVQVSLAPVQGTRSTCLVYTRPGIFGRVEGIEQLLSSGVIDDFYLFKTPGMRIGTTMASTDRVAAFIVSANSRGGALEKISQALETIKILDEQDRSLLLRAPTQKSAIEIYQE